jgi:hypothetical protein
MALKPYFLRFMSAERRHRIDTAPTYVEQRGPSHRSTWLVGGTPDSHRQITTSSAPR